MIDPFEIVEALFISLFHIDRGFWLRRALFIVCFLSIVALLASHGLSICANWLVLYIDSPPKRSPGKYKLSELGVVLWGSLLSSPELLHNELLDGGAPHNWLELPLHVSGGGPVFFAGLIPQPDKRSLPLPPVCCWPPPPPWLSVCRSVWASLSTGDSANIVVLPSTQLFSAPWACEKREKNDPKSSNRD